MITTLPLVVVNLTENGHPDYVRILNPEGLAVGSVISLISDTLAQHDLKIQRLNGRNIYLWNPATQTIFDASSFLIADNAYLKQVSQDIFGGFLRNFQIDPNEDETPLATSEIADIILAIMPGGAGAASNVTVLNFPVQQHVVVDNTVLFQLSSTQNTGILTIAGQTVAMPLLGSTGSAITVTGIWTGDLAFEVSYDSGNTYSNVECYNPDATQEKAHPNTTINGSFQPLSLFGATNVRVRASVLSSGAANVYISGTAAGGSNPNPSLREDGESVPTYGVMIGGSDGTDLKFIKVAADGSIIPNQTGFTDGSHKTQVTNLPATQPISAVALPLPAGAATSNNQTNGNALTQITQGGNSLSVDASGRISVNVNGTVPVSGSISVIGTVPVSGTFWQTTQPISAVALPLPAGAATSNNQTNGNALTQITQGGNSLSVDASGRISVNVNGTVPVSGTFWQTTQPISGNVGIIGTVPVSGTFWQTTQPVSAVTLPLPAGAATSDNQTNGNQITKLAEWTIVSTNNSSSTPLIGGGSFTGIGQDCLGYTTFFSDILSDQTGTLYLEGSTNNINWDPVSTYPLIANDNFILGHSINVRYMRIRIVNGPIAQSFLRAQSILTKNGYAGEMVQVGTPILANSQAQLTKSVLTGLTPPSEGSNYREVIVDTNGALRISQTGTQGVFGGMLMVQETINVSFKAPYAINTRSSTQATANGGTITWANSMVSLNTNLNSAGSASIQTKEAIRYIAGQGNIARFAPVIGPGIANCRKEIGLLTDANGFGFGYNGTQLGILVRKNSIDTWIPQYNWNGDDKFDGLGPSGVTLDTTKGSPMQITMQWLGFGAVRFYIESPITGTFILVHTYKYANSSSLPSIDQPSLPVRAKVTNTGNTSNATISITSMGGLSEGVKSVSDENVRFAFDHSKSSIPTTGLQIFSIRNKTTNIFGGTNINAINVHIDQISIRDSSNNDMYVRLMLNPTLTGTSWIDNDTNTSVIQTDIVGTYTAGTGTSLLTHCVAGGTSAGTDTENLSSYNIRMAPGDVIAVVAFAEANTITSRVALSWKEEN